MQIINKPTSAYVGASWAVLGVGVLGFLIGLWNAEMMLNEKGYYFMAFTLSLFAVITIQKNIRDLQAVKGYENPYEQGDVFLEKDVFSKEKE